MMDHRMKFDETEVKISGIGDITDDRKKLVVPAESLSKDYKPIKMITDNMSGVDLTTTLDILPR